MSEIELSEFQKQLADWQAGRAANVGLHRVPAGKPGVHLGMTVAPRPEPPLVPTLNLPEGQQLDPSVERLVGLCLQRRAFAGWCRPVEKK